MNVFTTINPNGDIESQIYSIDTWASKFKVYSVNTKEEILRIKEKFKNVEFIETDKVVDFNGKKLVKLNAILDAIVMKKSKYSCITNSDIILNKSIDPKKLISKKHLEDGIIVSKRYELGGEKIYQFEDGYDLFIFNIKNIKIFYNEGFALGMPWWDFWIPMMADRFLLKLYFTKNEVIYHKTHDTNYSYDSWEIFGNRFLAELISMGLKVNRVDGAKHFFENNGQLCQVCKNFIESKKIDIKI
jgi:hypothetical protein